MSTSRTAKPEPATHPNALMIGFDEHSYGTAVLHAVLALTTITGAFAIESCASNSSHQITQTRGGGGEQERQVLRAEDFPTIPTPSEIPISGQPPEMVNRIRMIGAVLRGQHSYRQYQTDYRTVSTYPTWLREKIHFAYRFSSSIESVNRDQITFVRNVQWCRQQENETDSGTTLHTPMCTRVAVSTTASLQGLRISEENSDTDSILTRYVYPHLWGAVSNMRPFPERSLTLALVHPGVTTVQSCGDNDDLHPVDRFETRSISLFLSDGVAQFDLRRAFTELVSSASAPGQ